MRDWQKRRVKRNQLCSNFLLDYRRTHRAKIRGWKKCISEQCNCNINHSIPFPKSPREFYAKGTLPHSLHIIYAETVLRRSKNSLGCSTCSWDWLGWTRIVDLSDRHCGLVVGSACLHLSSGFGVTGWFCGGGRSCGDLMASAPLSSGGCWVSASLGPSPATLLWNPAGGQSQNYGKKRHISGQSVIKWSIIAL